MKILNKILLLSILISFIIGCINRPKETPIEGTNSIALNKQALNGIWAIGDDENASFRIKGDSMYFLEDTFPSFIEIDSDILITHYEGLITRDKIVKLDQDSLVLLNEIGDYIKLKRRK